MSCSRCGRPPLGISEEYDALPKIGDAMKLRCQECWRWYGDHLRREPDGCQVLAMFCPGCRAQGRMAYADPLPTARVNQRASHVVPLIALMWLAVAIACVLSLFAGCSHTSAPPPVKPSVLDVRITEMPVRPSCSLPYAPSPPDDIELDYDDPDIIRRTTVNIRQHNALLEWARSMRNWVESVNECIAGME